MSDKYEVYPFDFFEGCAAEDAAELEHIVGLIKEQKWEAAIGALVYLEESLTLLRQDIENWYYHDEEEDEDGTDEADEDQWD